MIVWFQSINRLNSKAKINAKWILKRYLGVEISQEIKQLWPSTQILKLRNVLLINKI